MFEALPIVVITFLVIEGISFFIPVVKNCLGVVGPILVVLGAFGWRLLGSSANLIIAGIVVVIVRYAFLAYVASKD